MAFSLCCYGDFAPVQFDVLGLVLDSSCFILHWPLEKLIEGLKSPDTSSLMLPDLLSLSDPFGGSVEESAKGMYV